MTRSILNIVLCLLASATVLSKLPSIVLSANDCDDVTDVEAQLVVTGCTMFEHGAYLVAREVRVVRKRDRTLHCHRLKNEYKPELSCRVYIFLMYYL